MKYAKLLNQTGDWKPLHLSRTCAVSMCKSACGIFAHDCLELSGLLFIFWRVMFLSSLYLTQAADKAARPSCFPQIIQQMLKLITKGTRFRTINCLESIWTVKFEAEISATDPGKRNEECNKYRKIGLSLLFPYNKKSETKEETGNPSVWEKTYWSLTYLSPDISFPFIPPHFLYFLSLPFEMARAEARQLRMMPSMTLGFSGSERKSAVAIWCRVHPAPAATWHVSLYSDLKDLQSNLWHCVF